MRPRAARAALTRASTGRPRTVVSQWGDGLKVYGCNAVCSKVPGPLLAIWGKAVAGMFQSNAEGW